MSQAVLIADDHPLFREALTYIAGSVLPDCELHEAINYQETRDKLESNSYKLVFLDLNMPDANGLTDLALLKKMHPQVPMVVVSALEDPNIIKTCLDYNASGYIIKSSSPEEIKKAIKTILEGDVYAPPSMDQTGTSTSVTAKPGTDGISSLTPSQLKVLIEIGKGKLNKQIAFDLEISEATVKAHITSIFKKLGINNRTQAVLIAQEHQTRNPAPGNQ